ncbi:MAG TPA: DUF4164 family protein [Caulobacteraceae bacterium]|nr:DUF4164 family protein [Caulobacteraceae bacterium]
MTQAQGPDGALELAARRLERAVALLEQRIAQKLAAASAGAGTAFDEDRTRLAAALDEARARERELEDAGAAASQALARAIAEIRATLGDAHVGEQQAVEAQEA